MKISKCKINISLCEKQGYVFPLQFNVIDTKKLCSNFFNTLFHFKNVLKNLVTTAFDKKL